MFVQSRGLGGEETEVLCRLLRKHLKKDWQNRCGYRLQLNALFTTNNPGLLVVRNLLSCSAVSETKPLGSGMLKDRAWRGDLYPLGQGEWGILPPPLSCWGPGYRPQSEFCRGDHWLLCPLLLPASLLSAPGVIRGENEAQRGHRFNPAHTASC